MTHTLYRPALLRGNLRRCGSTDHHRPHAYGDAYASRSGTLYNICPGYGPEAGRIVHPGSAETPSCVEDTAARRVPE